MGLNYRFGDTDLDWLSLVKDTDKFVKVFGTIDQGEAGYLDQSPYDGKVCAYCTMFRSKAGKFLGECTYVQGSISPRGWCKFFKAKK